MILYEINNVRPITGGIVPSAVSDSGLLASRNRSDERKIPQESGSVKQKNSDRDSENLQKKYPQLNLNEDISELDGVPAIELTDGSVIP